MEKTTTKRLLALDILRGITIAGMILVNNPGTGSKVYAPLEHAEWNGLTPTDLVFPFFMFIMGISTYISLRKYDFRYSHPSAMKIVRRTIVIYVIGLAIAWLSLSFRTWHSADLAGLPFGERLWKAITNFEHLRLLGVMPRLAICYGVASIIALTVKHRHIPYLIAILLIIYTFILFMGNGFAYDETNILSRVDRAVLGLNHMYKDHGIDPEGLLSTISAIAHVLIGFCVGKVMMRTHDIHQQIERLFLIGTILTFGGFLLAYGCPINKKIWSPTYTLVTCGLAASFLAVLIWIIDVKGYKRWSRFFEAFGVNPLFMYVLGAIFTILLTGINFNIDGHTKNIRNIIYEYLLNPLFGDYGGSLAYALLFVAFNWCFGYILYKKKIYIKI
ncbi:DUF5009 domain-containing protein [Porphyromonas pogonae]|uniref:acyltransferase family protein n=1 Tax=Porphyromonas pogonae TaxID=867595 RepID=UPI002E7722E3|nr:DUF5009 domain-containing protein [Porphyromonas pogonae]